MTEIIDRLGGISATARILGIPKSTVSSWKRKGAVPDWRVVQLETAIRSLEDFADLNRGRGDGDRA